MKAPNYTQVSNEFIENMHKYEGYVVKVFLAISRKTIGWHKDSDRISQSQLKELTGLSVNTIKKSINILVKDYWIKQTESKFGYFYDLNIDEGVSHGDRGVSCGDRALSHGDTTKETNTKDTNKERKDILSKQILKCFNEITNHNIKIVNKYIYGRINEGFTLEDAQKVILYKHLQWKDDMMMKPFIRISTLFAPSHFEEYLSEAHEGLEHLQKEAYEKYKQDILENYVATGEKLKVMTFEEFNGAGKISSIPAYS